jgi:polysaccharide export outer membrane protein
MRKLLYLFAVMAMALTGCNLLYPSMMLETPKGFPYTPTPTVDTSLEYKISENDFINFRLFSNDGLKLIDFTNIGENIGSSSLYVSGMDYLVDIDGTVNLPVIGKIRLVGLTIREAIKLLEDKYSLYYIKPYILMKVTNRRVIIFPGDPGSAKVLPLINNNTTLFEALALAGGITESGKARQIKLIRGDPAHPQIYLIDLSTIYGIKAGSMVLQANDIVYVTPQRRIGVKLLDRITPTLGLLTSAISLVLYFALIKQYNIKL